MRKNWILLMFAIVTSIIAWNSFDFAIDEQERIEKALEEEIEYESSESEEEVEDEHLNTIQIHFSREMSNIAIFETAASFHYSFAINSFCKEPEVYPPCC